MDGESVFAGMVRRELSDARKRFPPMHSVHEGYAVILEEVDELWSATKLKPAARNPQDLLTELVQIAAMCQRTAEDIGLVQ